MKCGIIFQLVIAGICTTAMAAQVKRPNVVIFYTDDQKMDSFGFIRRKAHTPNIDRLARDGAYFSNAYASSSVCSPSRYSCITGQYASRSTAPEFQRSTSAEGQTKVEWNMGLTRSEWTFPKVMQQQGYKTGMVGKWHIGRTGDKDGLRSRSALQPAARSARNHQPCQQSRISGNTRADAKEDEEHAE